MVACVSVSYCNHVLRECLNDLCVALLRIWGGIEFQVWVALTEKADLPNSLFLKGIARLPAATDLVYLLPLETEGFPIENLKSLGASELTYYHPI